MSICMRVGVFVCVCPCGLSKEKDDGTELFKGQQQTHHQTGRQRGALITTSKPAHKRRLNCTTAAVHSRIQSDSNSLYERVMV